MDSVDVVERALRDDYDKLTPSQRRLAEYIYQNPYEVALMASSQIAAHLEVSEATVVRFAQALGFKGYASLRESLKKRLIKEVKSSERVATMVREKRDQAGTLHEIVSQNIFHLNRLLENVSEDALEKATACLNDADQIFVYGEGAPGSLTYHIDFWLSRLGCRVKATRQTGRRFYDYVFDLQKGDVALIMAFRSANSEAFALLEIMKERQGQSILITDLINSRMHGLATHILMVQRGRMDVFRSLGPLAALIDALILGLMRLKGDQAVDKLKDLDSIRHRYGVLFDK
ncbi:MAG: MurR/RpiR family transcriptional regulator [Firmicutes bacterium]|nr:MurR/RpiR family transcriptional regulator [Bacillota bacterium]